jgi:hypothetical protein
MADGDAVAFFLEAASGVGRKLAVVFDEQDAHGTSF